MSGQISEAIDRWADEVDSLGGSEPLTRYRDLKSGTLDLQGADPEARRRLLEGDVVRVSRLFPHDPIRTAASRSAQRLAERLWALESRHGLAAGYLATGLATWNDRMSARRPMAPILLRRLQALPAAFAEADVHLQVVGEPELNGLLLAAMAEQLGIRLTPDDLMDPSGELRYPVVVERLREQAPPHIVDGFTIAHRAVVACMSSVASHQATELREQRARFAMAPLVALAAGTAPDSVIGPAHGEPLPPVPPLDLDAAQTAVLAEVAAGRSVAVEAPAGTGAVQVAAGVAAESVAEGRTVLVVADSAPRLQQVHHRMAEIGLGACVLDLSDGLAMAHAVARDVLHTLDAPGPVATPSATSHDIPDHALLARYHDALHRPRAPWGVSAYDAIAAATLSHAVTEGVRVERDDLERLDEARLEQVKQALATFVGLDGLHIAATATSWFGASPTDEADAERAVALVARLRDELTPAARELSARAAAEVGMPAPAGPVQAQALAALLAGVADVERAFEPAVWSAPVDRLAAATTDRRGRRERADRPGLRERRALRKQATELARRDADPARLSAVLDQASVIAAEWAQRCRDGRLPRQGETAPAAVHALEAWGSAAADLALVHPGALPADADFAATMARLAQLADEASWARRLPRLNDSAALLADAGLGPLVARLRDRVERGERVDVEHALGALDACLALSIAEEIEGTDEVLGSAPAQLREAAERWRQADAAAVVARAQAVRHRWVERVRRAATERPVQLRTLRDAAAGRAPRTVRDLMAGAGDTVRAARPVWLAGPLTAAESLPVGTGVDVLVVLDGQGMAIAHVIGALARARQVVLLGDPQLPPPAPTPISVDAPDPQATAPLPGAVLEAPSVLAVLRDQLPTHRLVVRYGCRDERLHAVLPATRGSADLAVPPGASSRPPVQFVRVDQEPGSREQEESVAPEVSRVVELVRSHCAEHPGRSLAVLALGHTHAESIRSGLARACLAEPWLAEALDPQAEEPFLLRTVDDLHGERRDAVILSVGFGRTVDGRLLYRFGPLNRPGGVRWLAAAVATARDELTVVSSIAADELEPRRLAAEGLRALQELLAAAEGVEIPTPDAAPPVEPEPAPGDLLVHDLVHRLRQAGLPVASGGGTGGLAVPVVLEHSRRPGRGVLAVDTEGGPAAGLALRDRERLRPEQLQRAGWATHRVSAVGWGREPDSEMEALRAAWVRAQDDADAWDAARNAPPSVSEADVPPASAPGHPSGQPPERPPVSPGRPVGCYPPADLLALAEWLDETRPTGDEDAAVAALARELGVVHPGRRDETVLRHAIRAAGVRAGGLSEADPGDAPAGATAQPRDVPDPFTGGAEAEERRREQAEQGTSRDDWLADERPPHYD